MAFGGTTMNVALQLWHKFFDPWALFWAIVAALLLAVIGFFWKTVASFLSRFMSPVRVYGTWNTQIERTEGVGGNPTQAGRLGVLAKHETATLYQFGPLVWGNTVTNDKKRQYRVRGRITGEKLSMVYSEVSGSPDAGAILLAIKQEGKTMEGYEVGYDHKQEKILPRSYKWTRRQ